MFSVGIEKQHRAAMVRFLENLDLKIIIAE